VKFTISSNFQPTSKFTLRVKNSKRRKQLYCHTVYQTSQKPASTHAIKQKILSADSARQWGNTPCFRIDCLKVSISNCSYSCVEIRTKTEHGSRDLRTNAAGNLTKFSVRTRCLIPLLYMLARTLPACVFKRKWKMYKRCCDQKYGNFTSNVSFWDTHNVSKSMKTLCEWKTSMWP